MKRVALAIVLFAMTAAACESKNGQVAKGQAACAGTPSPIAVPSFPAGFPQIGDVTWTASAAAGPSTVIKAYTSGALEGLFAEMKRKFSEGGYSVTKSERDLHDAEVNFTGNRTTGQVRLSEECQGRTSIGITIRPE